jgi:hypothetical protein
MSCCWTDERWNDTGIKGVYGPQYYSQRGDDCPPEFHSNLQEYLSEGEEYAYLFTNGEWVCYDRHQFEDNKEPELVGIPSAALHV